MTIIGGSYSGSQGLIFYQDVTPDHMASVMQDSMQANCPGFIKKIISLDLHLLDYHVWIAMLAKYNKLLLKTKTIDELKVALQMIWEELPQEHINKVVENFTKRLTAGVAANGEHLEHMQ